MPRRKKRPYGTGSISKRAEDGLWKGVYKKYKPVYGHTYAEAEAKLDELIKKVSIQKMPPTVVEKLTVEEFMLNWLRNVERVHLKPKSYDRKEQAIRLHVLPYIGKINAHELTNSDVQSMVISLMDEGFQLSTIRQARYAVSAAYKWGMQYEQRIVDHNPAIGITMPTAQSLPPEEVVYFTQDEAEKLIEAAYATYSDGTPIYRLGAVVELIINTGLRQAEVLALQWDDVATLDNFSKLTVKRSVVHARDYTSKNEGDNRPNYRYITQESAKTRAGHRTLRLNDAARHALWELWCTVNADSQNYYERMRAEGKEPDYSLYRNVLCTREGTPVRERALSRMLEAVGKRAMLHSGKGCSAHPLRHTYATLYLYGDGPGKRGDVKELSVKMGHSDVQTTYSVYSHIVKEIEEEDREIISITAPAGELPEEALADTVILEPSEPSREFEKYIAERTREEVKKDRAERKKRKKEALVN